MGRIWSPLSWNTGLRLMPRMLLRTNGYQILRGLKMARRTGGLPAIRYGERRPTLGPSSLFHILLHCPITFLLVTFSLLLILEARSGDVWLA